jgi:hypothetical protein
LLQLQKTKPVIDNKKVDKDANIIIVGKNKFATGIFWQPFKDPTDRNKEIKASAKFSASDLFCIKTKGVPQYGLVSSKNGYTSGTPSAAAAASAILSDKSSTVAIFKVNIGWWLLVIRNDIILPEEDKIFKSEEDAKKSFVAMLTVPDWGYKICPESWNIQDTREISTEELLGGKFEKSALEKVDKTAMIAVALVACLIVVAGVGQFVWSQKREELLAMQRQMEEAKRLQLQREQEKKAKEAELAALPVPPAWEKIVDPVSFASNCMEVVRKNFQIFAGWKLKSITCNLDSVKIDWGRGEMGTNEWLLEEAKLKGYIPNETEVSISGDTASGIIPYAPDALKNISGEPGLKYEELTSKLNKWIESYGATSPRISNASKTVTLKENNKSEAFPYMKFAFENPRNPVVLIGLLKSFSGLEFISIKCDNIDNINIKWTYEGTIYAKK